ncbi:hypothetical protein R1sor_020615 [Riccia sorocarpa]|uniref:Uncharacterized protein n=1 Tax=Riccia sorocarpa TaxID=122646 RepID=A0ABD3GKD8_9MARC
MGLEGWRRCKWRGWLEWKKSEDGEKENYEAESVIAPGKEPSKSQVALLGFLGRAFRTSPKDSFCPTLMAVDRIMAVGPGAGLKPRMGMGEHRPGGDRRTREVGSFTQRRARTTENHKTDAGTLKS